MASGETLRMLSIARDQPLPRRERPGTKDRRLRGKKRTKARKAEQRAMRESLRA
jgi:hypothetical protein